MSELPQVKFELHQCSISSSEFFHRFWMDRPSKVKWYITRKSWFYVKYWVNCSYLRMNIIWSTAVEISIPFYTTGTNRTIEGINLSNNSGWLIFLFLLTTTNGTIDWKVSSSVVGFLISVLVLDPYWSWRSQSMLRSKSIKSMWYLDLALPAFLPSNPIPQTNRSTEGYR